MVALVTGANGFIGKALCRKLIHKGWRVRGAVRSCESAGAMIKGVEPAVTGEIGLHTDWSKALHGIEAVVHLAARVHVMEDRGRGALRIYRDINAAGTERLARAAADAHVRRIVYVSTIKVNGESSGDRPFTETDEPRPEDPYAVSKWEAEELLRAVSKEAGLEHVVIRPPLVYGPGLKANFLRLIRWIDGGKPLPFASVKNRRSLIALENLADLLCSCLIHPEAANRTFLASDGEDISTPELVRVVASALGKRPRLFPFSPAFLNGLAALVGRSGEIQRLTGSLRIDNSTARNILGWEPPVSLAHGIKETIEWFKSQ